MIPRLSRRERRALRHRETEVLRLLKLDVWRLTARERRAETRVFEQDGVAFALTLRAPNVADLARAAEVSQRMKEDFITGGDGHAPVELPGCEKPSEGLFLLAATIAEMQCPQNPGERYEPEELIQLAEKLPDAWAEAQPWIQSLMRRWETRRGERREPARDGGASGAHSAPPEPDDDQPV